MLAWNVTVSEALTAAPATSPVEASTPEGRSTETTGSPQALIRSISAAASGPGRSVEPGAEQRVDHDVAPLDGIGLDGLAARLAQHARGDPPVAAVRAAAADDGEPARMRDTPASPRRRPRRPPAPSARAPSPGSPGTPPRRRASRPPCRAPRSPSSTCTVSALEPHDAGGARHRVRVGQRDVDLAHADPLGEPRGAARQRHARLRRPDDLDVLPGEPDAAAERLADRLLAAEPGRIALGRVAPRLAVRPARPS